MLESKHKALAKLNPIDWCFKEGGQYV
jgi:hypothetical protein